MVESLPPDIRLKLDQALLQWHQWRTDPPLAEPPRVVEVFGSGISNHSILVEAGGRFVIRIDGAHPASNSLCRTTEWRALALAHAAGLAPHPRYYNPELGVLVCDYLAPDTGRNANPAEIAALLRGIHALPGLHHRLHIGERINHYERQLATRHQPLPKAMANCRPLVKQVLAEAAREDSTPVLCHNDLLAANRVCSDGNWHAIDWEYCAMGSPWYDLAVVIVGDQMDGDSALELLNEYLQHPAREPEVALLGKYRLIYQYLELAWYLANTPARENLHLRLNKLGAAAREFSSRENC